VGGKTGGAIWVCLDFLAPPFASRQKVEKQTIREYQRKKHDSYSNASLDKLRVNWLSMTKQEKQGR
jgi:hypothetical protein